jgi:hypothetical protein
LSAGVGEQGATLSNAENSGEMSTTTITTTTAPDGTSSVTVVVDGKTVLGEPSAEEGVPPSASGIAPRSAEEKAFLISKYPKKLEDIEVDWLSALMRCTVSKMVIKVKLEAGVTGDAAIVGLEYAAGSSGPESIVLKYSKDLEGNRQLALDANMYEKETFFYTELYKCAPPPARPARRPRGARIPLLVLLRSAPINHACCSRRP